MTQEEGRTVKFRVAPGIAVMIEKAAEAGGETMASFCRRAAAEAARRTEAAHPSVERAGSEVTVADGRPAVVRR